MQIYSYSPACIETALHRKDVRHFGMVKDCQHFTRRLARLVHGHQESPHEKEMASSNQALLLLSMHDKLQPVGSR